jgi:trehalose-6-phosphate synthase
MALERFLKQHPEWRDRVTMIQIAVPSRTDVPEVCNQGESVCVCVRERSVSENRDGEVL